MEESGERTLELMLHPPTLTTTLFIVITSQLSNEVSDNVLVLQTRKLKLIMFNNLSKVAILASVRDRIPTQICLILKLLFFPFCHSVSSRFINFCLFVFFDKKSRLDYKVVRLAFLCGL